MSLMPHPQDARAGGPVSGCAWPGCLSPGRGGPLCSDHKLKARHYNLTKIPSPEDAHIIDRAEEIRKRGARKNPPLDALPPVE